MSSLAYYSALIEYENFIRVFNSAYTLRNDDSGRIGILFGNTFSYERVGTEIERGKSIVENKYFGFSRESAGNLKPLFLSARKITPELSDLVVGFFVKLIYEFARLRSFERIV